MLLDDLSPFLAQLTMRMQRRPSAVAVQSRGRTISYGDLIERACVLANKLRTSGVLEGDRVAVMGGRGVSDYVAILGILLAGGAYVPLNPKIPSARNAYILEKSGAVGVLVDVENRSQLELLVTPSCQVGFALCSETGRDLAWNWPCDRPVRKNDAEFPNGVYIIFTSGTTGQPKGVPITTDNLSAYLLNLDSLFKVTPDDRIVHLSELSFDLSVHEIFMAWWNGASLYAIPQSAALMAPRYVEEEGITIWVSVPSAISLAHKAGTLGQGSMRSIRLAFFCGEALPLGTARNFAAAAPDAEIFNLWGPTETTVSFSYFHVDLASPLPDIIPIGKPYPNLLLEVADTDGHFLPRGETGELLASGSQVTQGYWQSPELTNEKFLTHDGKLWYRTGDLAYWDDRFGYCYLGRTDRQVKVKGFRVELQECESAIRKVTGMDTVCVVPWPKADNGAALGLVAFISGAPFEAASLKESLKVSLPPYMVPDQFLFLKEFPYNANGKVDYNSLEHSAEELLRAGSPAP